MKLTLILLIFLTPILTLNTALASEYGYLRVRVLKINDEHKWIVHVDANNNNTGLSFSHATNYMPQVKLSESNLSKFKNSTSISVKYGNLEDHGCKFDFTLEYSYSGNFDKDTISLGTYKAPTSTSFQEIPIGLGCKNGFKICSSDSNIQSQLEKVQLSKMLEDFLGWKERQKLTLLDKQKSLEIQSKQLSKKLSQLSLDNDLNNLTDKSDKIDQLLQNLEDTLNLANNAPQELDNSKLKKIDGKVIAEDIDSQFYQMSREERRKAVDVLYKSGIGAYGAAILEYDIILDQIIEDQKQFQRTLKALRTNQAREELYNSQYLISELEWNRNLIIRGEAFTKVAKEGLRFTPMGDAVDACEFTTGREYCDPKGRKLSNGEVLAAGLGLFIGNRRLWTELKGKLLREEVKAVEEVINITNSTAGKNITKKQLEHGLGVVREASHKLFNFDLGKMTKKEAELAGHFWVGPNPEIKDYRGHPGKRIYISQDGLKQYREPTIKKINGKYQANLQRRDSISDSWEHNGHIEITDLENK